MTFFPIFYDDDKTIRFINAAFVSRIYLGADELTLELQNGELKRITNRVDIDHIFESLSKLTGLGAHQMSVHRNNVLNPDE